MQKTVFKYGLILAFALIGFKTIEYFYFSNRISLESYLGIVAVIFLVIGWRIGFKLNQNTKSRNKKLKDYSVTINSNNILSEREKEVLLLISQGHTNHEISEKLFVSVNTVKTHLSNIYSKLNVVNRTQAISEANKLNIIKIT